MNESACSAERSRKPLSLCLPTNGVSEWVFPVLESIYGQNADNDKFEVIVTDNGDNNEFKDRMREYASHRSNLVYLETNAPLFLNMIESFNAARGTFIKFVNHRTLLLDGALDALLEFVEENEAAQPVVYFSNASLKGFGEQNQFDKFDDFVRGLSYWSSWSGGIGFWRDEYETMSKTLESFNETFPQTTILFNKRDADAYVIDNRKLMKELSVTHEKKGSYDLFRAFAVEYPGLILNLVQQGDVTVDTFLTIKNDTRRFLANLYFDFVIRKKPCSYDLSSYDESIEVFYGKGEMRSAILECIIRRAGGKIARILS